MPNNHGTAVAGIIGALRNNPDEDIPEIMKGIAGIAGGENNDVNNLDTGVELYSGGIFYNKKFSTISDAAQAIFEGAFESIDPNTKMGFGLHLQNHSWGSSVIGTNSQIELDLVEIKLLEEVVESAWRNHCVLIASRGNRGRKNSPLEYPACFADELVISVGASGVDGKYKNQNNGDAFQESGSNWWASSKENVDIIAPGVTELILTTVFIDQPEPKPFLNYPCIPIPAVNTQNSKYQCFNGTSAAAPHVTGTASLMYSKHNVLATPPAPNNLTTEDIEAILEKTAHNRAHPNDPTYYDEENGWGLIDAGEAVKLIDYPKYYVKHSDINTAPTVTLVQSNLTVNLTQEINGLDAGTYIADLYKYEWNYSNNVLNPGEEIIDWWPVHAGTYKGVSANTNINGEPYMAITPSVNIGGTTASVNVVTYAWWVKEQGSVLGQGEVVNEWVLDQSSTSPNDLRYMYSIHIENITLSSLKSESIKEDVLLYPNPTNDILNIYFPTSLSNPEIEIYNLEGKLIYSERNIQPDQQNVSIEIAPFSNGVYLFVLKDKDNRITKRFIKQ